jgi:signal transduction histidine kinase
MKPQAPSRRPAVQPKQLMSRFNVAFSLMSLIPLLTCCYLITVRFFSLSALAGINGVYFLLALVIALLGLLAGHELIRDIIRQLVDANAKLGKLNEQQAAFVSNVAHEFRSPLAVFKGALDNLADGLYGPLPPALAEPVEMCKQEVDRLTRLVSDLLDLARLEAGKLTLRREPVDMREVLRAVTHFLESLARRRGVGLRLQEPDEAITLTGDRDRLEQVFINLVVNALKFTPSGSVTILLRRDGEAAEVEVADTGPGIAPEDLERIFDKFERVGSGSEEGSGLGLPIARDIVQLHDGRIRVVSRPGEGSRFIVRLPCAPPAAVGSRGGTT